MNVLQRTLYSITNEIYTPGIIPGVFYYVVMNVGMTNIMKGRDIMEEIIIINDSTTSPEELEENAHIWLG